jgi:hypothetical protein
MNRSWPPAIFLLEFVYDHISVCVCVQARVKGGLR